MYVEDVEQHLAQLLEVASGICRLAEALQGPQQQQQQQQQQLCLWVTQPVTADM
jgi:hypothetical protein